MTTFNFQPDDPRLTAYALGELDAVERAQVEAMLAESAEARAALQSIRETIALLSRELTFEPALMLTNSQRQVVEQAAVMPKSVVVLSANKTSRWVVMVRTATTVAAVAAVAVAIPWVSRVWQDGSPNPSANDELAVLTLQASDETALEKELLSSSVTTSSKDEGEVIKSFAAKEITGQQVSGESLATIVVGDDVQHLSPADSVSLDTKGKPFSGRAEQMSLAGDASESKSERLMFGAGVGGTPLARTDEANGKNDSLMSRLDVSATESMKSRYSEAIVESGSRRRSAATATQWFDRAKQISGDSNSAAPAQPVANVEMADASTVLRPAGLGLGDRGGTLGREQLGESIELGKNQMQRFDHFSEAARGTETYEPIVENVFLTPMEQPLSTFSIDVDTASYANMRRFIQQGQIPPAGAVRIEELVNYFRYDYPEPTDGSPFSVNIDVATCPWNTQNKLARVGLKAKSIAEDKRPPTNLVFLIDVSGSMAAENKLPLVKQALSVLVSKMGEDDQIAIVTYAGEAGLKLNSTSGSQRAVIQQAIDSLRSGGSTNGVAGINIAYDTAIQSFIKGGANRVILCTDGDFNVGVSDDKALVEIIQEKAASGVFLSVFGFGMGNLKDGKLEKLADKGNGNYGYIDGLGEARKMFGEQLSGTLITVAKDVKLQLEFNNSTVGAYRLIGYENRVLAAQDFDDDTKDAGEIGAGHTVTALYEIVPKAAWLTQAGLDPEKFDIVEKTSENGESKVTDDGRLFTVKLRHKLPDAETSERSVDYAAMNSDVMLSDSDVDFRFAAGVAAFGMQLRDSKFRGTWTLQNVLSMADASLSTDRNGERTEFTDLVRGVMRIKGESVSDPRLMLHETVAPATPPAELSANDARIKATVDGKYRRLLKKIEVRGDFATYGDFQDFGHWDGTSYAGHNDLPTGNWVWVYPNWYIWGDVVEAQGIY